MKDENVTMGYLSKNPNSTARIVARLKRDHPDSATRRAGAKRRLREAERGIEC